MIQIENATFVGTEAGADRFVAELFARGTRIENLVIVATDDNRAIGLVRRALFIPDESFGAINPAKSPKRGSR